MAGILDVFLQTVSDALAAKVAAYNKLKDYEARVYLPNESQYNHFASIEAWNTHPVEWSNFLPTWNSVTATRAQYSAEYEAKNTAYKEALAAYEQAKKDNPQEAQIQLTNAQAQAQISQLQAAQEADKEKAKTALTEYKTGTTKYIIIAGVILVVIVVASWAYFKFIKKGAKA